MKLTQYLLPLAFTLLIIAFLLLLPDLRRCALAPESAEVPKARRGEAKPAKPRLALLAVTAVYALCAFLNLGSTTSPETFAPMSGVTATLSVKGEAAPSALMLFCGVGSGEYTIEYSADGESFVPAAAYTQNHVSVLKWNRVETDCALIPKAIRISCTAGAPYLGEVALFDGDGQQILLGSDSVLTDEQPLAQLEQHYLNSSYFDEIYHVRTAWEHLEGIRPYEISHPPLGKLIISLGIALFGMTPFGWRFSGTMVGVLMLPLMYAFLRRLFKDERLSILGVIIFAADFMHYAQTRIATIDSYAVFFILLMYYFMYDFWERSSWRSLALSGLAFGLGAASKWTCLYAGAGLGVIWLLYWLLPAPDGEKDSRTMAAFLKNIPFCVLFFVLIPAAIYYLSYLPYGIAEGYSLFSADYARMVWDNQVFMFSYHSGIESTHPYSSRWYQWLLNIRPILYYLEYHPDGSRTSIAAFLNPVTCWGGLFALFVTGFGALVRRDRRALFILLGYLAQLLPWVFISRLTFEYHYFPCSVFLLLAIAYVFNILRLNREDWLRCCAIAAVAAVLLFVLFFPSLSGLPVDRDFAHKWTAWLPTWPLVGIIL